MPELTPTEIRRRAAELIPDVDHWSTDWQNGGEPAGYGSLESGRFCMVGAMMFVASNGTERIPDKKKHYYPLIESAAKEMGFGSVRAVENFNDEKGRTLEDVRERLLT